MALKIAILEDNADRRAVLQRCLNDRFYTFEHRFFDDAKDMIAFLRDHLGEVIAISLDNDLDLKPVPGGRMIDPGSGVKVAELLATCEPVCSVILHTTNANAAAKSKQLLEETGWPVRRVIPFDGETWIESEWFFTLRRAVVGPIRNKPAANRETRV
jgi:hypothetical protein